MIGGGKMPAEWWREYRRKNRERIAAKERERRSTPEYRAHAKTLPSRQPEYRTAHEYAKRNEQRRANAPPAEPLPSPYTGHPILERARALAGSWYGNTVYDADKEDEAGEAVLAILEGRDPEEAVRAYRAQVLTWSRMTVELEHYRD